MLYILCILFGSSFGSFANVYFYRIPRNLSLIKPNSFCPNCNHAILWYDNVPILSFLLLKGKCRFCQSNISFQYPLIETLCGLIFLLVAFRFQNDSHLILIAFLTFSFLLFLISGIDFSTYIQSGKEYGIIPDHLIWMLASTGLFFCVFNPLLNAPANFFLDNNLSIFSLGTHSKWQIKLWWGFSGALSGTIITFAIRWLGEKIFKRESLGLGDVKMIAAIGFWIGLKGILTTLIIGSVIGSLVGITFILLKKIDRSAALPFGPFLALGAFSALFYLP